MSVVKGETGLKDVVQFRFHGGGYPVPSAFMRGV